MSDPIPAPRRPLTPVSPAETVRVPGDRLREEVHGPEQPAEAREEPHVRGAARAEEPRGGGPGLPEEDRRAEEGGVLRDALAGAPRHQQRERQAGLEE